MTSLIFSSLFLLVVQNAFAIPAPQGPAVTNPPTSIGQAAAQSQLAAEFAQEVSDLKAYASIPIQTSLSPEELAAESSIIRYYETASFSDIPYATSIPASLLAQLTATTGEYALPKQTDPCGPAVQDGTEFDTCTVHEDGTPNVDGSPFVYYTDEPAPYG
ncbi:MAG: hypothetical protein Q9225_007853, partial [Loekoesia sp. 1 TL-2023]